MKKRLVTTYSLWGLSCGIFFLVGRYSIPSQNPDSPSPSSLPQTQTSHRERTRNLALLSDKNDSQTTQREKNSFQAGSSSASRENKLKQVVLELTHTTDPIARTEGFLQLVKGLSAEEFLTVVDTYRSGGVNQEDFGEYRILLSAWARVAPLDALNYAHAKTGTPFARQTILATWAKNDPASAINWARDHFDSNGKDNQANPWIVGVIEGLAATNLPQATILLEELPFSKERGEALSSIFEEITQMGSETGKQWVSQLNDKQLQAGAAARLAGILAQTDPQEAAQWAATLGHEAMKRSAQTIVNEWVKDDFNAAKIWVEEQPEEIIAAAGPELMKAILDKEDPAAASEWLSTYDGNPEFDETIRTLVWGTMNKTPELGADWIMRLSSENDQTRTFHRVLRGWINQDPAGAMDYIRNNPVPESISRRAEMEIQQQQKQ